MRISLSEKLFNAFNILFLSLLSLICLFPFYYITVVSFTDPTEYYQKPFVLFPDNWTVGAYKYLISTPNFMNAAKVSGFLATVGTLLSLIVSSGIAYAISRQRLRFRRSLMLLIFLTTILQAGLIPSYLIVKGLGMLNSLWSLIIPSLTGGWYILLMKGFFDSIPDSLEEAARIDGCTELSVFFRIILPLSLPALVAFGLFFAVGYWNTFFTAVIYMNDHTRWPLQVLLQQMLIDPTTAVGGTSTQIASEVRMPPETLKMAAVIISTVPIMCVYPFLQKHFAKGAMVGSVKG
ncbi:carbohydrate ABC transporter permease [Paenibacillus sp. GD4]|uniref:carbohydrate ABC transporter permease n=1 Tax=Paenibacillus sp. GD4 TaxID=3068890 RepID=UPI002796CD4B|nr:carbohydrate ABC transporter permease [Paenibacillus sp. GD4]MDQ1914810.1 carbohydrate ABC transporter permease [Paenibacillus sp. GD4]